MADELGIKINELGAAQTILGTEFVPIDNGVDTLKATLNQVKEHAIGDNNISALGDGSVTGAILNVKSTSETADSNFAETMAQNGAHNVGNNEAVSSVQNAVTFTVNADKSITAVGTVTGTPENFYISKSTWSPCNLIKGATYTVSDGLEAHLSGYKTTFVISDGNQVLSFVEVNGVPQSITVPNNAAQILWYIGYEVGTVFNHTFKPMVKLASDPSTTYAPYAMTNGELTEKKVSTDKYRYKDCDFNNWTFTANSLAGFFHELVGYAVGLGFDYVGESFTGVAAWSGHNNFDFIVREIASGLYDMLAWNDGYVYTARYQPGASFDAYQYNGTHLTES